MKRMKKYENLHIDIALENINCMIKDFDTWYYIKTHQKEIKQEKGCKH